jgi:pyruvate dehydrogenase (quinone)
VGHLLNGLLDAAREGAPVIAIAGDTASALIDSGTIEEVNPYALFAPASLYTGRILHPAQTRTVVQTALRTAIIDNGPTVISVPGDIAAQKVEHDAHQPVSYRPAVLRPSDEDLRELASLIDAAGSVTIFGGDGCRFAHDEVVALAQKLAAPVGYAYRGKQWLEWDNPNAVGMSGLLGWGGAYEAMHRCDLCLLLGTSFPFSDFYPSRPTKVQIDRRGTMLGRRTHVDMALVGDVRDTVAALLPLVAAKADGGHLAHAVRATEKWRTRMAHYVTRGPKLKRIRPEYLVSTLDELADDDAAFTVDTGTACIWAARYVTAKAGRNIIGSFSWASMANAMPNALGIALSCPGRQAVALCGDGGIAMMLGELLTIAARQIPVKIVVLNNSSLDFVHIEMEEAGIQPFGTELVNPNFAALAESIGITGMRLDAPADVRHSPAPFQPIEWILCGSIVSSSRVWSRPPHHG